MCCSCGIGKGLEVRLSGVSVRVGVEGVAVVELVRGWR